jgi:hypothetical protein
VLAYLESIIAHLLRGTARVADRLPDVWKIHHPESVRTYRAEERRYKADTAVLESAKRKCRTATEAHPFALVPAPQNAAAAVYAPPPSC